MYLIALSIFKTQCTHVIVEIVHTSALNEQGINCNLPAYIE